MSQRRVSDNSTNLTDDSLCLSYPRETNDRLPTDNSGGHVTPSVLILPATCTHTNYVNNKIFVNVNCIPIKQYATCT